MVVMNDRYRYLLVNIYGEIPDIALFITQLRFSIKQLMGEIILAKSGVHVVSYNSEKIIVRTSHLYRDLIEAAIQLIGDGSYICCIRKVTGTIKSLNKNLEETIIGDED